MKSFFKDYGKLWVNNGVFLKEHWLGTIIFGSVLFLIEMIILIPEWPIYVLEKIQDAFSGVKYYFKKKRV